MRILSMRFNAVLEERNRLAREMHDTVIQGCTGISALLEAVSSQHSESRSLEQPLLDYARTQIRTTIDEARQAVWNLRHDNEPSQDLTNSIGIIAENTRKEFGLEVECTVVGKPFPVQGWIARELLMVAREAVYNAALHGHPQRITITLTCSQRELRLTIADDGIGFNPNAPSSDGKAHYGIEGMRERVENVNGQIEITSVEGKGSAVLVRIGRSRQTVSPAKSAMKV